MNDSKIPENLKRTEKQHAWSQLQVFSLEEIVPFAVFPILYPKDSIVMTKATLYEDMPELFMLGNPGQGETAYLPLENDLTRAIMMDPPGSGKAERIMRIAASLTDHH